MENYIGVKGFVYNLLRQIINLANTHDMLSG